MRTPTEQSPDGLPIFDWPTRSSFIMVVEGRPGTSNRPLASCGTMDAPNCAGAAALQVLADRALGNGSPTVCDDTPPTIGGVPAVPSLEHSSDPMVVDAINDFACRFDVHATSETACTLDELGNFAYVRNRPSDPVRSTLQYCTAPALGMELSLKPGQTRFKVQLIDVAGNAGNTAEIIVRTPLNPP
ncbi:MAG: hypothetical protein AB7P78_10010 [Candidatus Binatia bacterium]